MVERITFDQGELVVDDRYFPVVVSTWSGEVTREGVDVFFRWHDRMLARAAEDGVRLLLVTDLLGLEGVGVCGMRRRFVEEIDRREAQFRDHVDFVMVVAQRPLVLGTLAAMLYQIRPTVRLSSFRSLSAALHRALLRLDGAGVGRPPSLDPRGYAAPFKGRRLWLLPRYPAEAARSRTSR